MNVIDVKHVEDCFDGSAIYELLLDAALSKEAIFELGAAGDMQYFGHFARPFFKIRIAGRCDMKGIEGNTTMRVQLTSSKTFTLDDFLTLLATVACV